MRFSAEELNTVLAYIKEHANRGVLDMEGYPAVARETGLTAGHTAAVFYFLCGEGKILQEGNRALLLDGSPYENGTEV